MSENSKIQSWVNILRGFSMFDIEIIKEAIDIVFDERKIND